MRRYGLKLSHEREEYAKLAKSTSFNVSGLDSGEPETLPARGFRFYSLLSDEMTVRLTCV
jgi:hypothetical protein